MYWHILVDPEPRTGPDNMALDQALLDRVAEGGNGVAYLRLYRWEPPCLSFGRNEPALSRYDRHAIERLGVDVVRRPTGGRAVWHQHEVTYAVAAPVTALGGLRESYLAIHQRLAAALRRLGAAAELAPRSARAFPLTAGACFARPVGGEVIVSGRKVVGSAQVRQGSALLQHGSILLDGSQDLVERVSKVPAPAPHATTLSAVLGRPVTFAEVSDAIVATWTSDRQSAGPPVRQSPSALSPVPGTRFHDAKWTWRR